MTRIFLSFLGNGDYYPTVYTVEGTRSAETEFVQEAELQVLGSDAFDRVVIVATPTSGAKHFNELEAKLNAIGFLNIHKILVSEELDSENQWSWFEEILGTVGMGDELTVDMTHGYRIFPIIIASAINFLQKARGVVIRAVYYGAFEKDKSLSPVIDMKEFYIINEWADGVSRLVEDADARKLAEVAGRASGFQAGELNDDELVKSFESLTNAVRNIDIHNISEKAGSALGIIEKKMGKASVTGRILLGLVFDKFASLAMEEPAGGMYNRPYFAMQLEVIGLLLEHRLYMQAFTVMREFIGSLALGFMNDVDFKTSKGRKKRRYADLFITMAQFDRSEWEFDDKKEMADVLIPVYEKMESSGAMGLLKNGSDTPGSGENNSLSAKGLVKMRNGFDHAWTACSEEYPHIKECGYNFYEKLSGVVRILSEHKFIKD